ncbi:hypothetical protein EAO22_20655 [Klebsiella pneumoniae]|nr:hypothetical protein EAO22_20655 [Klebsiella pneumoniae]
MRSTKESSGNGKALEVNGLTFDSEGLICDGIDGHYADTGIIEPLANTVIMAFARINRGLHRSYTPVWLKGQARIQVHVLQ